MNKLASISAITLVASAGFATAGTLDLDRAYATELRSDAGAYSVLNSSAANLEVTAGTRFGYRANFRRGTHLESNDRRTVGFEFQDVEVRLTGQVTDSITATVSFDFGPDDNFASGWTSTLADFEGEGQSVNLEDAYADWMINDGFTLRIGQFVQQFSAGRSMSEYHMMGAYRSNVQNSIGDVGWSQGVEAHFGGDTWSAAIGFTDGPFSANTAFNDAFEADYAINARFDLFSDGDKNRFRDATSWRGSSTAWRVGAGALYASYGDTNPSFSETFNTLQYTVDAAYAADGWGVNGAFFGQRNKGFLGDNSIHNWGFELGANMFFNDQVEGYARWDSMWLDRDLADAVELEKRSLHNLAVGFNYYFVPESHAAKFTGELGWAFRDTRGDIDEGFFGNAFLGNSDKNELNLAFMFQFMF